MLGRTLRAEPRSPHESALVIGTFAELRQAAPQWKLEADLAPDGYWLKTVASGPPLHRDRRARRARLLYGTGDLLRRIALGESIAALDRKSSPYAPVRWVNQWDNSTARRARLRRTLHLLGQPESSRRPVACLRLRKAAGLARHQRLLHRAGRILFRRRGADRTRSWTASSRIPVDFIALGSNVGDREKSLRRGWAMLEPLSGSMKTLPHL